MKKIDGDRAVGGRFMGVVVAALFALVCASAEAASNTSDAQFSRSKTLRYSGAALDNPAAVQKLYTRLRIAAKQMCERQGDEHSNGVAAASCERAAMATAVAEVNRDSLTALHRARTQHATPVMNAWLQTPTPCKQCG